MPKYKDLVGKQFGQLAVIQKAENNSRGKPRWLCRCSCGNEKIILQDSIVTGRTRSCGCLYKISSAKTAAKRKINLPHYRSIYNTWAGMISRCNNINNVGYKNYGGRGIAVCDEWYSAIEFYNWAINNGYKPRLTLDRIDVNGNYEPCNCRWATMLAQQNNRRNNHKINYNGELITVSALSKIIGIDATTLLWRINHNWCSNDLTIAPSYSNKRRNAT